jgi:hypothetical protein
MRDRVARLAATKRAGRHFLLHGGLHTARQLRIATARERHRLRPPGLARQSKLDLQLLAHAQPGLEPASSHRLVSRASIGLRDLFVGERRRQLGGWGFLVAGCRACRAGLTVGLDLRRTWEIDDGWRRRLFDRTKPSSNASRATPPAATPDFHPNRRPACSSSMSSGSSRIAAASSTALACRSSRSLAIALRTNASTRGCTQTSGATLAIVGISLVNSFESTPMAPAAWYGTQPVSSSKAITPTE